MGLRRYYRFSTPHSRKSRDISYYNRGVRERKKGREGVGGGRNWITYWLSVFYLTACADRDAFGRPPPPPREFTSHNTILYTLVISRAGFSLWGARDAYSRNVVWLYAFALEQVRL